MAPAVTPPPDAAPPDASSPRKRRFRSVTETALETPAKWKSLTPVLGRWFSDRDVPKATQVLRDLCTNLDTVADDVLADQLQEMRTGKQFDDKAMREAIHEHVRMQQDAIAELSKISESFDLAAFREFTKTQEWVEACPISSGRGRGNQ